MNLHAMAIGPIKIVHKTEVCNVYQSSGQTNNKGKITSTYKDPFEAEIDVQPMTPQEFQTYQEIRDVQIDWKCYMYSTTDYPIAGTTRLPELRTGDFIKRANGRWLLITAVLENWVDEGWCCVGAVEQQTPPELGG